MNENFFPAGDLIAYLDGELDSATQQQVAADARLLDPLRLLDEAQQAVSAKLRGIHPPSPLELGEYQLGLLPAARAQEIARYLKRHPHAAEQVNLLAEFLAEPEPGAAPATPNRWRLLRLLFASVAPPGWGTPPGWGNMQPALAGLRGEQTHVYQAEEVQIILLIDRHPAQADQRVLSGMTLTPTAIGFTVRLFPATLPAEVVTSVTDSLGNFEFPAVSPGIYQIILSSDEPALEIHLPLIEVE